MNRLLILVSFVVVIFFTYGCAEQTTNSENETLNVETEKEVVTPVENENPTEDEEQGSLDKALEGFAEAGKEINLTEEEMIQKGEEAIQQFQKNLNIKTMDEFEAWYTETMYNEDYYGTFKEAIKLGETELISVDVKTTSVSPNSAYTYQWNGIIITKYKSFTDNLIHTTSENITLQMYENERGQKDYKIIRINAKMESETTEPLQ